MFLNGTLTAAATNPVSSALLRVFFPASNVMARSVLGNLNAARFQLKQQYAIEYAKFGADTTAADAWLDAVLVLELAADLHEKEEMLIYDFVADPKQLASNQLEAFEGFFEVSYRKHDYDYGRSVAQQKLAQYKTQPGSVFSNLHRAPKPIDPIDPSLNNPEMSKVDVNKRTRAYKQICEAANVLLSELSVNIFVRKALMWFFIQGEIKKILAL
jgi:hypothetical protein